MADKKKLNDMLDSLIDTNSDQAQVHFHDYLEDKMKEVLNPDLAAAEAEADAEAKVDDKSATEN